MSTRTAISKLGAFWVKLKPNPWKLDLSKNQLVKALYYWLKSQNFNFTAACDIELNVKKIKPTREKECQNIDKISNLL